MSVLFVSVLIDVMNSDSDSDKNLEPQMRKVRVFRPRCRLEMASFEESFRLTKEAFNFVLDN